MSPLIVVFSTPVLPAPRSEPLGVLGLAVHLGAFNELEMDSNDKWMCLVQTRRTAAESGVVSLRPWQKGITNEGLFLEHRELEEQRKNADPRLVPRHLLPEQVEQLRELGERKAARLRNGNAVDRFETLRLDDYQDAVGKANSKYNDRWLVSAEPVVFAWREPGAGEAGAAEVVNPGWVVLVQERYREVANPARALYQRLALGAVVAFGLAILLIVGLWGFVLLGLTDMSRSRLAAFIRNRAGLSFPFLSGDSSILSRRKRGSTIVRPKNATASTPQGTATPTSGKTLEGGA
jgi:hypothetical protein